MPAVLIIALVVAFAKPSTRAVACRNACGDIPIMYPFGTDPGCGNRAYEQYINCSMDRLEFYTPTGLYYVQSIDYGNNIIIVLDPTMSTCSSMHVSHSFGLPVGAPFSISTNTVVLLGCSATSSIYKSMSSICDPTGTQICKTLYGCSSVGQLGLPQGASTSTCCVYSSSRLSHPPYNINLALLQCSSYTSIYSFGPEYSYGRGPTTSYQNPNSWSYGIALTFASEQSTAFDSNCQACRLSNGVCATSAYGVVCVCSGGLNATARCPRQSNSGSLKREPARMLSWRTIGAAVLLFTAMTGP